MFIIKLKNEKYLRELKVLGKDMGKTIINYFNIMIENSYTKNEGPKKLSPK
jgi:hypothetical protein